MRTTILITEDDTDINNMLRDLLQGSGYQVQQAFSGTEALMLMRQDQPAAVILDLMLPGMAGEDVLRHIQQTYPDTAVIISSAKDEVQTKIALLRAGADDYLSKPFDTDELLARLEVVLRRRGLHAAAAIADVQTAKNLKYKDIEMQPENFGITVSGMPVKLTKREYLILQLLMQNPSKVFTKNNIYESVWNEVFLGEDNAVNVHISNIRQKLAKVSPQETYIETVWGIGFKMK